MNDKTTLIVIIVILGGILLLLLREIYKARQGRSRIADSLDRLARASGTQFNNRQQHSYQTRVQENSMNVVSRPRTETRTPTPVRQNPVNRPVTVQVNRNDITETGTMIYFANDRHGRSDKEYRFNYKKVGDGWRAYILRTPSFGSRSMDSGTIHRLTDGNGQHYICWDRKVDTLKDMQTISRYWADRIQEYIATGRFNPS